MINESAIQAWFARYEKEDSYLESVYRELEHDALKANNIAKMTPWSVIQDFFTEFPVMATESMVHHLFDVNQSVLPVTMEARLAASSIDSFLFRLLDSLDTYNIPPVEQAKIGIKATMFISSITELPSSDMYLRHYLHEVYHGLGLYMLMLDFD
jgi:hypothetical protein